MTQAIVIFNTGQSNSRAFGTGSQPYPGGWPHGSNVKVFSTTYQRMDVYVPGGLSDDPGYWGPEAGFADAWLQDNPSDQIFIVKRFLTANPLAPPNWAPYYLGSQWQAFVNDTMVATTLIKGAGFAPVYDTWLHIQGETDATSWIGIGASQLSALYRWNTDHMMRDTKQALHGCENMHSVLGRIFPYWDPAGVVRQAIEDIGCQPGNAWVDLDGVTTVDGGGHMDAVSTKAAGQSMYAARKAI